MLPTVDLEGVEILAAAGPIHGLGSPPEGDDYTPDELQAIAAANRELADELQPPNKIGHSDKQALAGVTEGELPAIGWLDGRSFRVSDDGQKLLADIRRVPEKVANLIRAGGYRSRSVELSKVTSQKTGKTYDWAVSGLAWLGAKLPAVRTLDDVVALYESDGVELARRYEFEPDSRDLGDVLAGVVALATDAARKFEGASDTRAMAIELNEDQAAALAKRAGLDGEFTADQLVAKLTADPEPDSDDGRRNEDDDERIRSLEEKADEADKRSRKLEEDLRLERRRSFVEDAIKAPKIEPGQRADLEALYDKDPDTARKFVDGLPVREDLKREFGSGEEDEPTTEEQAAAKAFEADLARRLNIKAEELI